MRGGVLRRGPVLEREVQRLTLADGEARPAGEVVDLDRDRRAQGEHIGAAARGDTAARPGTSSGQISPYSGRGA